MTHSSSCTRVFPETLVGLLARCFDEAHTSLCRHLNWWFGKSLKKSAMSFAYQMCVTQPSKADRADIEWKFSGGPLFLWSVVSVTSESLLGNSLGPPDQQCSGVFHPHTSVAVLQFFLPSATIVNTLRIVDKTRELFCILSLVVAALQSGSLPQRLLCVLWRMTQTTHQRYSVATCKSYAV